MVKRKYVAKWRRLSSPKKLLAVFAVLILLAGGVFGLTKLLGNSNEVPKPASSKGESGTTQTTDTSSTSVAPGGATTNKDNTSPGSTGSSATLKEPSGTFVSNHKPNLGGSPAPNTISSVCITTPGAICNIAFNKDGVTKSLGTKVANGDGAAYWTSWKLQDIGINEGSWSITATASLNGQNKSTSDSLPLKVSP